MVAQTATQGCQQSAVSPILGLRVAAFQEPQYWQDLLARAPEVIAWYKQDLLIICKPGWSPPYRPQSERKDPL